jgi:hypothetical protein
MATDTNNPTAPAVIPNPYTAETQEKIARLRALAAEIPDYTDAKPLTRAELVLVAKTSTEFLEKGAVFADAAPALAASVGIDPTVLRNAAAFSLAWGAFVDEAVVLLHRASAAIDRHKLNAALLARALYRVSKGYVTTDAGSVIKPHVVQMGQSLARRKSRKPQTPKPAPAPVPNTAPPQQ